MRENESLGTKEFDFFKKEKKEITKFHDFLIRTTAFAYLPHKLYVANKRELTEREKDFGFYYALMIWFSMGIVITDMLITLMKL